MDRDWEWKLEHCPAMCACRSVTIGNVLCAPGGDRRESAFDASSGRAIHTDTVLWCSEDAPVADPTRLRSQSQESTATFEANGIGGDLREAAIVNAGARPPDLSISSTRAADPPARSRVGHRYNVRSHAARVCLSCRHHGLVQPVRSVLGIIRHDGCEFLCDGTRMGIEEGKAGDFQFRSRLSIHERSVYECSSWPQSPDQHGWTWPGNGQYFRGTPMADRKIRRNLPEGLRERSRSDRQSWKILSVLQSGTFSPILGLSNSSKGLLPEGDSGPKTAHGNDRVALRSPLVGLYRANFLSKKSVKSKKEAKMDISLWKLTLLWKSAKNADSPKSLEKPSAFPQFQQALRGFLSLTLIQNGQAAIHLKSADFLS